MINLATGKEYSAKNCEILEEAGYECEAWAGFKQWLELGRVVRKGEKATKIMMICEKKDAKADGEDKKKKVMKYRSVFNYEQTEELAEKTEAA